MKRGNRRLVSLNRTRTWSAKVLALETNNQKKDHKPSTRADHQTRQQKPKTTLALLRFIPLLTSVAEWWACNSTKRPSTPTEYRNRFTIVYQPASRSRSQIKADRGVYGRGEASLQMVQPSNRGRFLILPSSRTESLAEWIKKQNIRSRGSANCTKRRNI